MIGKEGLASSKCPYCKISWKQRQNKPTCTVVEDNLWTSDNMKQTLQQVKSSQKKTPINGIKDQ